MFISFQKWYTYYKLRNTSNIITSKGEVKKWLKMYVKVILIKEEKT